MLFAKGARWTTLLKTNLLKILFAVKAGLASGAVYYLSDQGVWRDSNETTKLYDKINESLKPYVQDVKKQIPIEIPELPSTNRISYLSKQYWNQGVSATFLFIGDLPAHISDWAVKGVDVVKSNEEIKKFIDSFSANPTINEEPSKAKE